MLHRPAVIIGILNLVMALLGVALARPLIHGRVPMNRLYGVRFARSFESDALWYAINRYGGKRLELWSWVLAAIGLVTVFLPVRNEAVLIALACAPLIYLIPCIEAYRYSRRL